jgi:hypothetical protein
LVHALDTIEPETAGLGQLLTAFEQIIDAQIASQKTVPWLGRKKRARARPLHKIPRAVIEGREQLIVAYGESARDHRGTKRRERLPVYFTAKHLGTGQVFSAAVKPTFPLSPAHLAHMELGAEFFDSALSLPDFCDAWRAFVAREDVVTAYNKSTLDLLVQAGVPPARGIALKGAYFNLGRATGSLDDVVLAEGLIPTPLELAGRAARRLGNAIALSEWLGRYPAEIYGLDA